MVQFESGKLAFGGHSEYTLDSITYFFADDIDTFAIDMPIISTFYHTNPNGQICYVRNYNSMAEPTETEGDLITYGKIVGEVPGDSILFHFYCVSEPYFARYDDLNRRFVFSVISDNDTTSVEYPIDEDLSAVFVNREWSILDADKVMGIAIYEDLIYSQELDSAVVMKVMYDTAHITFQEHKTGYNMP